MSQQCVVANLGPFPSILSGYTVTMAPYERLLLSLLLWRFIGHALIMLSTPNVVYPIELRVKLLEVLEQCSYLSYQCSYLAIFMILSSKFYHFEGSCAPRVPSSSKEYCAPDRARLYRAYYSCRVEPCEGFTF